MRIPGSLRVIAGTAVLCILLASSVEGKKIERTAEVTKEESKSVQQQPTIFSFIRRLFPNPEKTLETLKAVAEAAVEPRAKSISFGGNRNERNLKSKRKEKPEVVGRSAALKKKSGKSVAGTTAPPKKVTTKKTAVKSPATTTTRVVAKSKSAKFIKPIRTTQPSYLAPPTPKDMIILSHEQKRDRLRQDLVKETEDNCLAKILCGNAAGFKPKPKKKTTFVSDSAYLIKEFFNIFDFTIDEAEEKNKQQEVKLSVNGDDDDKPNNDEEADEEEDDADDEEDEIYRQSPVDDSPKKKYSTNKPKKAQPQQQTSQQPVQVHTTRTSKPVTTTTTTTTTTTSTTRKPTTTTTTTTERPTPKEDGYGSILTGGDMTPVISSSGSSNLDKVNKNRLGHPITLSSTNYLMNTLASTSVSGSATLKPFDLPFEIPLQTAKDTSDDDDEEDDNNKFSDDRYDEDNSNYHRVTLEELVGDIKLTPEDLAMFRRGRSMRVNVNNVTSDKYIRSKLRQMNQVNNEVKKLRIAQKIGRSMREPRQCRQFSQVAEEVLQTCPLTSEVIRFFNANLKNSSVEVKRTPPGENGPGGLVVLGDEKDGSNQAFFVDSSPQVANTKVETDLKNPSIPSSYGKDEDQYTVYEKRPNPNPQNSNLNQNGEDIRKRRPSGSREEGEQGESEEEQEDDAESDEDEDEEEDEQDDAAGRKGEEEDEDEAEDEEDEDEDDTDDDDGSDDNNSSNKRIKKVQGDHQQIQGVETNQPNEKVVFRPKPQRRPTPAAPTLPPGIIRVYGVPQPSFDKDFSVLADQLGPKPLAVFGEEDIDRPAYKRRRQLPVDEDDDEKEDAGNVAFNSKAKAKHPPLGSDPGHGESDDDDHIFSTRKPYKTHKKKHSGNKSGKPLGGLKVVSDADDDDDDHHHSKKKKKGHASSLESIDMDESPFSPTGFYDSGPQTHDYYHHQHQSGAHQGSHHSHSHSHSHYHQGGPHHSGYGYRPIVRPIKIIPDAQVPAGFRPTRSHMRPGRLYPLYNGRK